MPDDRIALDVMGGDRAPQALLAGALAATAGGAQAILPERVLLVGDEDVIAAELEALGGDPGFSVRHASQVIGMHEKPAQALRAKPDSSIAVGVAAVREGAAGAFVSMGNTGAVVGAGTLGLGTLSGVRRPGIAVTLELTGQPLTMLDMGANVVPKPPHLVQYGLMGTAFMRDCRGVARPRVGLLNIGQESTKGTDLLRAAHLLLDAAPLDFVGNVEGGEIFRGEVDVVVTDGFTGNVALKLMEGLAGLMLASVEEQLAAHAVAWSEEVLTDLRRKIDYAEYGGALLLGVAGVIVIGHGHSGAFAVANALRKARRTLDSGVNEDIVRAMEAATAG